MRHKTYGFLLAASLVLALAAPAFAHHSFAAEYNTTKRGSFTGTLTKFALINPHVRWYFDVKNPDGSVTKWEIAGAGAGPLRQTGMSRIFKVGDTYKVTYVASRDGSHLGRVVDFTFEDGRVVTLFHEDPNNPNDN